MPLLVAELQRPNEPWRSGVSQSPERRTDDGGAWQTCRSRGWNSRSRGWGEGEWDWQANPGGTDEERWQSSFADEHLFQDQRTRFQQAIEGPIERFDLQQAVAVPPAPDAIITYQITVEPPPERFDLEYFLSFQDFTWSYRQHNVALKWFRQFCENAGLTEYIFSNTAVADVPIINHRQGMSYSFDDESMTVPWRWQEMVANLNADAIRDIICRYEP